MEVDNLHMTELNVTSNLRNKLNEIYSDFTHYSSFLNDEPSFFLCFGISYIHSLIAFKALLPGEANQNTLHDSFWKILEDYNGRVASTVESAFFDDYDKQCFKNYLKLVTHLKEKTNGEDAMRTFYLYLTSKAKVCRGIDIGFRAIMSQIADGQEESKQVLEGQFEYSTEKKRFLKEISQRLNAKIIFINNKARSEELKWPHKLISANTGIESPIVTLLMKSPSKFYVLFYKDCIASGKSGFIFHIPAKPIDIKKMALYHHLKDKFKIPQNRLSYNNIKRSNDILEEKPDIVNLIEHLSDLCIKYVAQNEKNQLRERFGDFINNHPTLRGTKVDILLHSEPSQNKKIKTILENIKRESEEWKTLKVNVSFKTNVEGIIGNIDKAISDLGKKFIDKTCEMMQDIEKKTLKLQKSLKEAQRIIDEAKENLRQAEVAEDGEGHEDLSNKIWRCYKDTNTLKDDFLQKYENYRVILNTMFEDFEQL